MSKSSTKKGSSIEDRVKRHERALEKLKLSVQIRELKAKQKALK